jgi:apolipoprotein N-acyltransferase
VQSITVDGVQIGPVICFEALFAEIAHQQAAKGARMLAVVSIDDWYTGTGAPDQLRALSVWRSVETGLPLVRSATMGYSLATDGKGRILGQARFGRREALRVQLPLPTRSPFFPGSVIPPILFVSAALLWTVLPLFGLLRRKRD